MENEINISILGDICPQYLRPSFDTNKPEEVFNNVLELLENSDLCIANLEAPAIESPSPIKKTGPILSCKPNDIKLLKESNISYLSLANNHIKDHGDKGVLNTIDSCRMNNIHCFGAGTGLKDAKKPLVVSLKEKNIGVISFAESEFNIAGTSKPGANPYDPLDSYDDVNKLKNECDYVVVLFHGGIEHFEYPSPLLKKRCRKFVDCGANIVICQHSHCIGSYEQYRDSHIIYGQGNSVFGKKEGNAAWNSGLIVQLTLKDEGNEIAFVPIQATEKGVELSDNKTAQSVLDDFTQRSLIIDDDEELNRVWVSFCREQADMYLPLLFGKGRVLNLLNRITKGTIMKLLFTEKEFSIAQNLIRCESHNEVVLTVLDDFTYKL